MITIEYIASATKAITDARKSVELAKSGQLYVPTVRRVVKELSNVDMERLIMSYLVRLNASLNLARPMNEVMIKTTAEIVNKHILEDDCDITLADLRIIFERAMMGYYGYFYNGIGLNDVIRWVDTYIGEKCDEYERWYHNQYSEPDPYSRISGDRSAERNAFHEAMVHFEQERQKKQNE